MNHSISPPTVPKRQNTKYNYAAVYSGPYSFFQPINLYSFHLGHIVTGVWAIGYASSSPCMVYHISFLKSNLKYPFQ
jgi:hypothetical protein